MNDYIALRVDANPASEDIADLIAASLAEIGFESFEPDASGTTAYIRASEFSEAAARDALSDFPIPTELKLSHEFVEGADWNAEWEKNYFQPIVIADRCVVHSSFHKDVPKATYDIVIDPKMAFGTGHHATTSMMAEFILESDMDGKSVIDMGTGTGILSILAAKRGASAVGIEIDEGAWQNACECVVLNAVEAEMLHGDAARLEGLAPADFFFANINRNIILADIKRYSDALRPGGVMLLSGFYEADIPLILARAEELGLTLEDKKSQGEWRALKLTKAKQ